MESRQFRCVRYEYILLHCGCVCFVINIVQAKYINGKQIPGTAYPSGARFHPRLFVGFVFLDRLCFVDNGLSFCTFYGHCVVGPSNHGFWLSLWYLYTLHSRDWESSSWSVAIDSTTLTITHTTINLLDVSCLTSSGKYNMHTQDENEVNNIFNQSINQSSNQSVRE